MAASQPLIGTDLVDCARANSKAGLELAAQLCGYGKDITSFQNELEKACLAMGITIYGFSDLIPKDKSSDSGIEFAPQTSSHI